MSATASGQELPTPLDRIAASAALDRIAADPGSTKVRAAVCLLVMTEADGEPALVLTRRTLSLRSHKGQWPSPAGGSTTASRPLRRRCASCGRSWAEMAPDRVLGELDDYSPPDRAA